MCEWKRREEREGREREEGNELRPSVRQSESFVGTDGMSLTQRDFKMEITVTAAAKRRQRRRRRRQFKLPSSSQRRWFWLRCLVINRRQSLFGVVGSWLSMFLVDLLVKSNLRGT